MFAEAAIVLRSISSSLSIIALTISSCVLPLIQNTARIIVLQVGGTEQDDRGGCATAEQCPSLCATTIETV
jgi:hypothetical protein